MDVNLNGKMTSPGQASIRIDDAGLQHAVGLFETMAAFHGKVFRLQAHLERLGNSARELGLARDLDLERLRQMVDETLRHNALSEARVRLTVTAGSISLLRGANPGQPPEIPEPTILVVAQPPTVYDPAYFTRGIMAVVAPPAANPFDPLAGHKTLSYWGRLRTLRQAAAAGAGEAIWLNISGHLAGGAISNIFLVHEGRLLTPIAHGEEVDDSLPAPVLPGITRAAIIELAEEAEIKVERRMLSVPEMLEADEIFLTNSSWQVLPVTRIEKKEIAGARVGPVTEKLREGLLALIERECGAE